MLFSNVRSSVSSYAYKCVLILLYIYPHTTMSMCMYIRVYIHIYIAQALLFSNVRSAGDPDERVIHRACAVEGKHVKVGMNLWVVDESMAALACSPGRLKKTPAKKGGGVTLLGGRGGGGTLLGGGQRETGKNKENLEGGSKKEKKARKRPASAEESRTATEREEKEKEKVKEKEVEKEEEQDAAHIARGAAEKHGFVPAWY